MTKRRIVIATRESPLALQQTELVKAALQLHHPHLAVELLGIKTQADKMLDMSLSQMGGKGLFVKELEEALLKGRADIAVHSMKDVPMDLPEEFSLPVICAREEPRDVFVSNQYNTLSGLPRAELMGPQVCADKHNCWLYAETSIYKICVAILIPVLKNWMKEILLPLSWQQQALNA